MSATHGSLKLIVSNANAMRKCRVCRLCLIVVECDIRVDVPNACFHCCPVQYFYLFLPK